MKKMSNSETASKRVEHIKEYLQYDGGGDTNNKSFFVKRPNYDHRRSSGNEMFVVVGKSKMDNYAA